MTTVNKSAFLEFVNDKITPVTDAKQLGYDLVIDAFLARGLTDSRWLAYILAFLHYEGAQIESAADANTVIDSLVHGTITGKALSHYLTLTKTDFVNSSRVVDRKDQARIIADYAYPFLNALNR